MLKKGSGKRTSTDMSKDVFEVKNVFLMDARYDTGHVSYASRRYAIHNCHHFAEHSQQGRPYHIENDLFVSKSKRAAQVTF